MSTKMNSETRDPRIDPKPGDVIAGFNCEVVRVEDGCFTFNILGPDGQITGWDALSIDGWQVLKRDAKVIRVAD